MLENLKGGGRLHFLISYTYGIADFLADFMVCADFMGGFILTPKSKPHQGATHVPASAFVEHVVRRLDDAF